jgi:hypothetical protein
LTKRFGSIVGGSVCVAVGRGAVGVGVSMIGVGWIVPVGVHGTGWKGVGVAVAFGAAVTSTNDRTGWTLAEAGARLAHPVSNAIAIRKRLRVSFMIPGSVLRSG